MNAMRDGDVVLTRRYAGETFSFIYNKTVSWVSGEDMEYFTCKTPENCFGYPDTVFTDMNAWTPGESGLVRDRVYKPKAHTLHRYLQPWILRRIEVVVVKLTDKYINNVEIAE